jgi:hypothetical protein
MEVSGQLHAPAALPQEKTPWYPQDININEDLSVIEIMMFEYL